MTVNFAKHNGEEIFYEINKKYIESVNKFIVNKNCTGIPCHKCPFKDYSPLLTTSCASKKGFSFVQIESVEIVDEIVDETVDIEVDLILAYMKVEFLISNHYVIPKPYNIEDYLYSAIDEIK